MFSHTILGGEKENWLIAFYGYGQQADVYSGLYGMIKHSHNLLIIDNPMQDYDVDIYPDDLNIYLGNLFKKYSIEKFNSVSYSMGSRLNLYLPAFFPKRLKMIIIVAPDGIKYNFWNRVAISTPWGRRIFKFFVLNGPAYMKALLFFHRIGIVNKSLYAFSKWNMRDEVSRKKVYNAWMNMRYLRPNLKAINHEIEQHDIKLVSFFGKRDPVIPVAVQERCKRIFPNGKHLLIDSDHNILRQELFSNIVNEIEG